MFIARGSFLCSGARSENELYPLQHLKVFKPEMRSDSILAQTKRVARAVADPDEGGSGIVASSASVL